MFLIFLHILFGLVLLTLAQRITELTLQAAACSILLGILIAQQNKNNYRKVMKTCIKLVDDG